MPKAGYYAVKVGKRPGIYTTWEDCREQVDGYPCAKYKKLRTVEEAEAWILGGASQSGLVEQCGVPYPVRPKTKPANRSLDQASAIIWSQSSEQIRVSSSPTIRPTPTIQSDSRFQPASGPSNGGSRAAAEPSGVMASSLSVLAEDVVYTDGACSGNGQYGSVAGIGVWWGPYDARNLSERCPGRQTNNRAELIAIIRALETAPVTSVPLVIKSDSEYAIKCFTDWLPGWRRRNFTTSKGTPVKNVDLVKYMDALFSLRQRSGQQVRLEHVRGHAGEEGNEGADALAVSGTKLQEVEEPDWDALRFMLEKEPMRGTSSSTKWADASIYADMVLDEHDLLAELEED